MLIYAVITTTLALVFYTIGVWSEKRQGELKKWHLVVFWLGLVFDTTGTTIMSKIATGGFKLNFHKLSIVVWIIWLVPFISGMIFGMVR